jgi:hypothetical protein
MSYQTMTTALLTLVRAYSSGSVFHSENTSEDDWTVLGQADIAAIVHMAGDTEEADFIDGRGSQGKRQVRHSIGITVAQPVGSEKDATALDSLHVTCDSLSTYLRSYARLGGTTGVKRAEVVARTRARLLGPRPDQGTHWYSTIVLRVWEEVAVTYASGDGPQ